MLGSEVLEVGIGMAMLFLFVSLIATAVQEAFEGLAKYRAKDLERGIQELLADPAQVEKFYGHPLVASLYKGGYVPGMRKLPSYIPSGHASSAILDLVFGERKAGSGLSIDSLRESLSGAPSPTAAQRAVLALINTADHDLTSLKVAVEKWYDGTMDRVSGWYKRRSQTFLFGLGLVVAVTLNIDAISVASYLLRNKTVRETIVARAETYVAASRRPPAEGQAPETVPASDVGRLVADLERIGYPIGWPAPQAPTCRWSVSETCGQLVVALPGWLITALAVMLGAPFWFDILNKFTVIRSTVKPAEKSKEEGSEDRTAPASAAPVEPEARRPRPAGAAEAGAGEQASAIMAATATALAAASSNAFVPHEWADGRSPQEGVL